jgi:hypothetical protein
MFKKIKSYALILYEVIDILQNILVISLSRKPLTLQAWKFLYNKTMISWKHCSFVLHVRGSLRESYCTWNFIIFTRKFKAHKLFVVERRNQLWCDQWPLTLKIGQGQRSRSSSYCYSLSFRQKTKFTPYYVSKSYFDHSTQHVEKGQILCFICELWPFTKLSTFCKKSLLLVYLENRFLYIHENLCITRP